MSAPASKDFGAMAALDPKILAFCSSAIGWWPTMETGRAWTHREGEVDAGQDAAAQPFIIMSKAAVSPKQLNGSATPPSKATAARKTASITKSPTPVAAGGVNKGKAKLTASSVMQQQPKKKTSSSSNSSKHGTNNKQFGIALDEQTPEYVRVGSCGSRRRSRVG